MKKRFYLLLIFCLFFLGCLKNENIKASEKIEIKTPTRFTINNNTFGLFDENKKVIYKTTNKIYPFIDGYAVVANDFGANDIADFTVIDSHGKERFNYSINMLYNVWFSSEGYFVCRDDKNLYDDIYVLKDSNGNVVDKLSIWGRCVHNGYYPTKIDESNEFMVYKNVNGSYLKKNKSIFKSYICNDFSDGYAVVGNEKKLYGLIDLNANLIIPYKFKYIGPQKYNNIVVSSVSNKQDYGNSPNFGLLDLNGDWLLKERYYQIIQISKNKVAVKNIKSDDFYQDNGGWSLIDLTNGNEFKLDEKICFQFFRELSGNETSFYNGIAVFSYRDEDLYGLIDENGKVIQDTIYDYIESHSDNGYWQVKKDGKWYLFNVEEGIINPVEYLDFSLL